MPAHQDYVCATNAALESSGPEVADELCFEVLLSETRRCAQELEDVWVLHYLLGEIRVGGGRPISEVARRGAEARVRGGDDLVRELSPRAAVGDGLSGVPVPLSRAGEFVEEDGHMPPGHFPNHPRQTRCLMVDGEPSELWTSAAALSTVSATSAAAREPASYEFPHTTGGMAA